MRSRAPARASSAPTPAGAAHPFSVASMLISGKYFPDAGAPGARRGPRPHRHHAACHDGWRTAEFFPPAVFFVDAQKLKAYADTYINIEYVEVRRCLDAERRVDQIESYFDTVKPPKAFVWVHFFEPHEPYVAHTDFPFGATDIDRYDSEIAYVDRAIGRLIAYLHRVRPRAIVILAADHGEEFDEHGGRYHGSTLYDEQLHIPMIVAVPGVSPRVVPNPVELYRRHTDGAEPPRHPGAGAHARDRPRALAGDAARRSRAPAAGLRRAGGQADGGLEEREADLRSELGVLRLLRSGDGSRREAQPGRRAAGAGGCVAAEARRLARRPRSLRAAAGARRVQSRGRTGAARDRARAPR